MVDESPGPTALPREVTAVRVHGVQDLRVERLPAPRPAADETLVRIAYGGICGSDLHYWQHGAAGESILREPMTLGHEVVGTVLRPAADGSGPAADSAVAVHPATPGPRDGIRWPASRPNLSPGCTYLGSAAHLPHRQGAFASVVALPSRMLRTLPAGLPLERAALAEPAAVAWHAVNRARAGGGLAGRSALVIGCGPIGLLVIAVLRRAGVERLTAVDLVPRALDAARAVGATDTVQAGTDQAEATIADVQADIAIESSGSHRGLAGAIAGTARGGTLVMLGLLPPGPQPVPVSAAIAKEIDLLGSFRFNDEIDEVLTALADGSLSVDPVTTHTLEAVDARHAFALAADSHSSSKVLLRF
jgi:threonine dehydrogenase-like Zn-dependent dehydrogenase